MAVSKRWDIYIYTYILYTHTPILSPLKVDILLEIRSKPSPKLTLKNGWYKPSKYRCLTPNPIVVNPDPIRPQSPSSNRSG